MKLVFKIALLLLPVLVLVTDVGAFFQREYTKTIKKEFEITPNGTTHIDNHYGKVEIKTWDRNRVKIATVIAVRARDEAAAQKVFDRVQLEYETSLGYVRAKTDIKPEKTSWWSVNVKNDKSDFSINYEVFLPVTNSLKLDHRYGEVWVDALEGTGTLDIKHASFDVRGFDNDVRLDVAHSRGVIRKTRDVRAKIESSKVHFEYVKDLAMDSKHSEVIIDRARNVYCESKHNVYTIGKVDVLRNRGGYDEISIDYADAVSIGSIYTNVKVNKLNKNLDLDMEYGGVSVKNVSQGFSEIILNGNHSEFDINLEKGNIFKMEASADYAGIRYPSSMVVVYEKDKGDNHQVKGYIGTENAPNTIKARLNHGALKVDQQ